MRRNVVPLWTGAIEGTNVNAFVALFTLEAVCRALPMALVPLLAKRIMGDAQSVSLAYFIVGCVALLSCLLIPGLTRLIRRRGVMTLGGLLYVAAALLYLVNEPWALIAGLSAQMVAAACLENSLSLYVLDHVPRQELGHFEPKRMLMAGAVFIVGPWLGVELMGWFGSATPFVLMAVSAAVLLATFWAMRIKDNPAVNQAFTPPPNPLRFLPRFFKQPRLRLAWSLALGRTSWWIMFFVYAPIFVIEQGYSERIAGMVVSLGTMAMLLMPVWAKIAEARGTRVLLMIGYGLSGVLTVAVAFVAAEPAWLAVAILTLAGIATTTIDGVGNVPFLRAVHPYERGEMTAVFTTYRQTAQLAMPGLFAGVLLAFPLTSVFAVGGTGFLLMAWLAHFIPRKM